MILLDKKELKKAAKEISVFKIKEAIEVLQSVIEDREKEMKAIEDIKAYAKQQGFSLEQLGFSLSNAPIIQDEEPVVSQNRPVKPKLKTLNPESQFFYVEGNKLFLLKTHTMKKALEEKGLTVVPFSKVEKKYTSSIPALIEEATKQATESYNQKVDVWNDWAATNNEVILEKKIM